MCGPKPPPPPPPAAERQAVQLPDQGSTANKLDQIARRKRAMAAMVAGGKSGLGAPMPAVATTNTLGA